jgi:hypothetical protein
MTIRASLPVQLGPGVAATLSQAFDGETGQAVTKYLITPGTSGWGGTTVVAVVRGLASADANGNVVLVAALPDDLSEEVAALRQISPNRFVYSGLPIAEVKGTIIKRPDTSLRTCLKPDQTPKRQPANAEEWAQGQSAVFVKKGDVIWTSDATTQTTVDLGLSVGATQSDAVYSLDAHDTLRRLLRAGVMDGDAPAGLFDGAAANPLQVLGPGDGAVVGTVTCQPLRTQLWWRQPDPPAAVVPTGIARFGPDGAVDFALLETAASPDWSAVTGDTNLALAVPDSSSTFSVPALDWDGLGLGDDEAIACTAFATDLASGGQTFKLDLVALQHPEPLDRMALARAFVPLEGLPRALVRLDDFPGAQIAAFDGDTDFDVKVGGFSTVSPAVSPDGQTVFFTIPPGQGVAALHVRTTDDAGDLVTLDLPGGVSYTQGIAEGLTGLGAALGVLVLEAALAVQGSAFPVEDFAAALQDGLVGHEEVILGMLDRVAPTEEEALLEYQAARGDKLVTAVNLEATRLGLPPLARVDGCPWAGADEEPEVDLAARTLLVTSSGNVVLFGQGV